MLDIGCSIEFEYIYIIYFRGKRLKICKFFIRLCGWYNKRIIIELF